MDEQTKVNHKLIGQIYDAAIEPALWSDLLYSLSENLDELVVPTLARSKRLEKSASVDTYSDTGRPYNHLDTQALEFIGSHISRALDVSERLDSSEQLGRSYKSIFDKLPIPAFIIDQQFSVLSKNTLAHEFLSNHEIFGLHGKVISIKNHLIKKELLQSIAKLSESETASSISIRLPDYYDSHPVSLLISAAPVDEFADGRKQFLVLVASPIISNKISHEFLMNLYGLTKHEAIVAVDLLASKTLNEIAQERNLSVNTIRSQLKSVFLKTGTNRQPDLVRLILTSPYLAAQYADLDNPTASGVAPRKNASASIVLKDERTLGYAEYGDANGEPVFVFHPSTGSRLQSHPNDEIARTLGARIIIPDRPGFGLSSPMPQRTLMDWPGDVEQLAERLGMERFSVLGFCGGGPYALACANVLADRLKHVTIASGVTPYENINLLHGVSTINKVLIKVATLLPNSIYHVVALMLRGIANEPSRYLDQLHGQLCRTDSEALSEPEFLENFIAALGEAFRQGPRAFSDEQLLFSQSWGFQPQQIKTPVTLWHGEKDQHVSVEHAKRLLQDLPSSEGFILPNYGHFMIYHRWRAILSHHLNRLS